MAKILDFLAEATNGKNYKSYKYCFESVDVPKIIYDDKKNIQAKRKGETDRSLKSYKSVENLAMKVKVENKPIFKYFLDGSRRTYKIDDIAYGGRLYPVIAGQIGVAVCERESKDSFRAIQLENPLVISIPEIANANTSIGSSELFFNNLKNKVNKQPLLIDQKLKIRK